MAKQSRNQLIIPRQNPSKNKPRSVMLLNEDDMARSLKKMNDRLRFSFDYFDRAHDAFNCGDTEDEWFIGLMDSFKDVSNLSLNELKQQRQHYDAHEHDWFELDYEYNNLPSDLWKQVRDHCLQFRISQSDGRVHGFTISNTFYVVWLDPHHNLYPSEKHCRTFHSAPLTPYHRAKQELQLAREEMASINQKLYECEAMLDELTDPAK